ncbi:hypothetical protein ACJJTC_015747 [Scirpophaga incertulas]
MCCYDKYSIFDFDDCIKRIDWRFTTPVDQSIITMKYFVFAVLAVAALSFSSAEDDGQYHPELYGDDGQYRPNHLHTYKVYTALDNSYKSLLARNGKYHSIYSAYQPVFVRPYNPYQQLLTPYVNYGDHSRCTRVIRMYLCTYVKSCVFFFFNFIKQFNVQFVPVVSSTSPIVYASTPKPIVFSSTPKPVYAATVKPITYSSTQKPLTYKSSSNSFYSYPVYAKNYEGYARIIKQENEIDPNSYHYSYETENGINAEEAGAVDPVNGGGTRARGFFEYIGDDGRKYRVDYTADENGFHPSGAHLPQ